METMKIDLPTRTIFYTIENAIKQYRRMSQKNISEIVGDITIDQALVLILLQQDPRYSQSEIAEILFKDYASITRMIQLMVRNGYLKRKVHKEDKRRSSLKITVKGEDQIDLLMPVIRANRAQALQSISKEEIDQLHSILHKLITNCSTK